MTVKNVKVLFLDDNNERTKAFKSRVPSAETVETSQTVIAILSSPELNLESLFLDHDLGGEEHVDSNREDCGMEVVRWMSKNKVDVGEVIIHSHNVIAAEKMRLSLEEAGYNVRAIPFRQLITRI